MLPLLPIRKILDFLSFNTKSGIKKTAFLMFFFFLFFFSLFTPTAQAAINEQFNYQGKLTDSAGNIVSDGAYNMSFSLYTQAGGGAAIWTENWTSAALFSDAGTTITLNGCAAGIDQISYTSNTNETTLIAGQSLWNTTKKESTTIQSVNTGTNVICIYHPYSNWISGETVTNRAYVKNGLFSVMLGSIQSLSAVNFNQTLYLGLTVGTDSEMKPRKIIGSVPSAIESQKLQGATWDAPAAIGTTTANTGKFTTLEAANTGNALLLSGNGANIAFSGSGLAQITTGTNQNLALMPNGTGKVGVNVTNPTAKLQVNGSADEQQLIVQGNATQTTNLTEWRNSTGITLASITNSGSLNINAQNSTTNPAEIVFTNTASNGDFRIRGDGGDIQWQGGGSRQLQMGAYHGLVFLGGRNTTSAITYEAGTGNAFNSMIRNTDPASVGLIVKGAASQTGDLVQWQDSSGNILGTINSNGKVGIGVTAPTSKLEVSHSTSTASESNTKLTYTQATNAANISGSALDITATSSNDAGDTLNGININNITATNSTENALVIGSGWDTDLTFVNSTPNWKFANGFELNWNDGSNGMLQAKDLSTNFGLALNAGAFIDRNSSLQQEFNTFRTTRTADTTGAGITNNAMGDGNGWGIYENINNGCTFSTPNDTINGIQRIATGSAGTGCLMMADEALNDPRNMINATNLPVFLTKIKPSAVGANNNIFIGAANATDGAVTDPTSFIGFTNNGGSTWTGRTTNGGTSTNVTCTGQTISTTNFALLMTEVRSTTDVRFYVDNNVSDGISFTYCGQSTANIPVANIAPEIIYQARAGGTAATNLDVDFYRLWQDDNIISVDTSTNTQSNITIENETTKEPSQIVIDKTEFQGNIIVKGQAAFGPDSVGQAKVLAGADQVKIKFNQNYDYEPIVTLTPVGEFALQNDFRYTVTDKTTSGFSIKLNKPQNIDLMFDWHSFGAKEGKIYISDGSTDDIKINQELIGLNQNFADPLQDQSCQGYHYVRGFGGDHKGVDLAKDEQCDISAIGDGKVIYTGLQDETGNMVKIDHGNNIISMYMHGNGTFYVKEGDTINKGQKIMQMGTTGKSTGPHLHLALKYNNEFLDPALYIPYTRPTEITVKQNPEPIINTQTEITPTQLLIPAANQNEIIESNITTTEDTSKPSTTIETKNETSTTESKTILDTTIKDQKTTTIESETNTDIEIIKPQPTEPIKTNEVKNESQTEIIIKDIQADPIPASNEPNTNTP